MQFAALWLDPPNSDHGTSEGLRVVMASRKKKFLVLWKLRPSLYVEINLEEINSNWIRSLVDMWFTRQIYTDEFNFCLQHFWPVDEGSRYADDTTTYGIGDSFDIVTQDAWS